MKTESRYKGGSQLPWENFQSAFQHAIYLRLAEKRALYQKTLESARIQKKYGKAAERKIFEIKVIIFLLSFSDFFVSIL